MRGVRGFPQRHEIDYLLVGHVARDLVEGGDRPGGTVVYAGHTARQLGCRVGIVTSAAPTEDLTQALTGLAFVCRPAAATTTFVNRSTASGRTQRLLARAAPLEPCDVPPAWHSARIVHLGPLVQEIGAPWLDAYPPEPG
ncbi:MAG: hypothetical protein HYY04_01755, partial [Chloroflexi bacterium]|nr:hypothetical protein [Chloroflexota bacterium]